MAKKDPNLVQVEDRKMVRDMRSKALLSVDITGRAAYMKRRAMRRQRRADVQGLRLVTNTQSLQIAELKAQLAELTKLVKNQTTTKKKVTRRKKSEDS
ncbi:MAG: hypothetical protein QQN46_03290 [Nitrosopumilus sp.]